MQVKIENDKRDNQSKVRGRPMDCGWVTQNPNGAGVAEDCDDGNAIDDDACSNLCVAAVCGDGIITGPPEACDELLGLPCPAAVCVLNCTEIDDSLCP